jgi:O-methyltransferase
MIARRIFELLPEPAKRTARAVRKRWDTLPVSSGYATDQWIRRDYFPFGQRTRREIFLSIARFHHINRPMTGYYFEFGSHEANTMRMAWDTFRHLFDYTYVAFDSFEGLPQIEPIDEQKIWEPGKLKTDEADFRRVVERHGVPPEKLMTVKGFYDKSLNDETARRFAGQKAAVVYVDCDLYASTVPVLRFVRDFLQRGTVIVFDDWFCFHGDPELGERRAWSEFLAANPTLRFEPFVQTQEAQSFIFLGSSEEPAEEAASVS